MSLRVLLVLALSMLGIACAPDTLPKLGERVWTGEHLEVWATPDAVICAGSYEALDRHAALLTEELAALGVNARDERYRYTWLSEAEYFDADPCPDPFRACVAFEERQPFIYGFGYSAHEVTHAEFATEHHSFVDEGLAVMFGDAVLAYDEADMAPSIPDVVDDAAGGSLAPEHYGQAGSFVRTTEELYPESYLDALLETRRGDDFAGVSGRFGEAGLDIDASVELYASAENCFIDSTRRALYECSVEPTPWREGRWTASGAVDCDVADTLGPTTSGDTRWTVRSIDISEPGQYTAWFDTDAALIATMVYCDAPWCGSGFAVRGNLQLFFPGTLAAIELQAGRYWFRVEQRMDDPEAGAFELNMIRGWHAEDPRE